jgi:GT2 family glycosyltransferase
VIDIIIPVYRGLAATQRCIRSVLDCSASEPHHVIVVDDATPEAGLAAWLDEIAAAGRVELLRHEANRGFVASVNEAMSLHTGRDVVLLNSDTEVAGDWLDRIAACARREANVATVTPFTNNGSICS